MMKAAVIAAFRASLTERVNTLKSMRDAARAGTRVDGEHRPSNRGERAAVSSQGYLTAGLDARMADIEAALGALDEVPTGVVSRVSAGAFVEVEEEGVERAFFVLPGGAGEVIDGVTILSPSSPVVRPLLGLEQGDVAELASGDEVEVCGVR
jgi:transcription elongation GreA/GreB family factor